MHVLVNMFLKLNCYNIIRIYLISNNLTYSVVSGIYGLNVPLNVV